MRGGKDGEGPHARAMLGFCLASLNGNGLNVEKSPLPRSSHAASHMLTDMLSITHLGYFQFETFCSYNFERHF